MMLFDMYLILPFVFVCLFLYRLKYSCWRRSFLSASIYFSVALTVITELLSALNLLTRGWVFAAWLLLAGVLLLLLLLAFRRTQFKPQFKSLWLQCIANKPVLLIALTSFFLILVPTFFLAVSVPPNNWDSMTYHMSRVVNWIHNQSVWHYPTHNLRQIDSPPWSGFAILHLQVLSGGDQFANLVQWFSMIGCLIAVSLMAQELGAGLWGQVLSAVICLTVPMGLLQSVTTQNDYVVAYWSICFAFNVWLLWARPGDTRLLLEAGASMGLALLTKATAYIYTFPFWVFAICLLGHACIRSGGRFWKRAILIAILINAPVVLLNAGHWWRNIHAFGTPLGVSGSATRNHLFTVAGFLSNLLRGISVHLVLPFQPLNEVTEQVVIWLHQSVLGLSVNDPRTTLLGQEYRLPVTRFQDPLFFSENITGNPIHLVLLLITLFLYFLHSKNRSSSRSAYLLSALFTLFIFNILIAWQPWISRLHLPFFVLVAPFVGAILDCYLMKFSRVFCLAALLVVCSLPCVFVSANRPLVSQSFFRIASKVAIYEVPRVDRYFVSKPKLKELYESAVLDIRANGCQNVGLITAGNSWEYPLWAIAQQQAESPLSFRAVLVGNPSKKLAKDRPPPCSLLVIDSPNTEDEVLVQGLQYRRSATVSDEERKVGVYYPVRNPS
ncbi:MAG: hypothetical protein SNJ57_17185 [Cyanobacteriota bacterium]